MSQQSTSSAWNQILVMIPSAVLAAWMGYSLPFAIAGVLLVVPWVVLMFIRRRVVGPGRHRRFLAQAIIFDLFLLPGVAIGIYRWQTAPGKPIVLPINPIPGIFSGPNVPTMPKTASATPPGMLSIAQAARQQATSHIPKPALAMAAGTAVSVVPWKAVYQHKGAFEACQLVTKMSDGGVFDLIAGGGKFRLALFDPVVTFSRQSPDVGVDAVVDSFPSFSMPGKALGSHVLGVAYVDPRLALEVILLGHQAKVDFGKQRWQIDLVDTSNAKATFFNCVNHMSPPIAPPHS